MKNSGNTMFFLHTMNQNQQHAFLKGKDITKDFKELRYGFSKSKIKKIIKNIYDIKKPKKSF